ncbi:MAG: class I SAM-dependent methyltransferase [Candidatus Moranbacteria bacterium]|nr:class I SAM-dependent methyltransferase [Candidatus Moranbacteria bacterium]
MIYILPIILIFVGVGLLFVLMIRLSALLVMPWGAPYVPCKEENRELIRTMIREKKRVLDLGSGDGRVVADLAAENETVHGYEINPFLVWKSRTTLRKAGLSGKTRIFRRNFWNCDLGEYDAVCVYGISYMMERLEKKLLSELPAGATVVSVGFRFPNWQPVRNEGAVWLYEKG